VWGFVLFGSRFWMLRFLFLLCRLCHKQKKGRVVFVWFVRNY
jgi:hypothetical protein